MDRYFVTSGDTTHEVELQGDGAELVATVDGRRYELTTLPVGRDSVSLTQGTDSHWVHVASAGARMQVELRGHQLDLEVASEREWHLRQLGGAGAQGGGARSLVAPMPGKILQVSVAPGDRVEAGTSLVVLEAMKMENELKATADGVVERVTVSTGDAVEKDTELVVFTLEEEAE